MERVLIICHDYHPMPSANTLCLDAILTEMGMRGITVDLVCSRPSLKLPRVERTSHINVYRVASIADILHRSLSAMAGKEARLVSFAGKVLISLFRIIYRVAVEGYVSSWRRGALKACKRLLQVNQYDAMISVSLPFATSQIALKLKLKRPSLPWLVYELDPFTFNYILPSSQLQRRLVLESRIEQLADMFVSSSGIIEENTRRGFRIAAVGKQVSLPLPNLDPGSYARHDSESRTSADPQRINLVYTGTFYGRIRPPEALGELLLHLKRDHVTFHLYGGSCENYFRGLGLSSPLLELHGRVSKLESDQAVDSADILINIGNDLPNQIPSKLFAYMSTGKPILHLSQNANDPSLPMLNSYAQVLVVATPGGAMASEVDRIRTFLHASRNVTLTREQIETRMRDYLSRRVVEDFMDSLESIVDHSSARHGQR